MKSKGYKVANIVKITRIYSAFQQLKRGKAAEAVQLLTIAVIKANTLCS